MIRLRLRIAQWIAGGHAAVIPTKLFVAIMHDAAHYRMEHPDEDGISAGVWEEPEEQEKDPDAGT